MTPQASRPADETMTEIERRQRIGAAYRILLTAVRRQRAQATDQTRPTESETANNGQKLPVA